MVEIPKIKLNNGLEMPVFGLGIWQYQGKPESEVIRAVKTAIDSGYRLIDCAHVFDNEKAVGQAIQEKINEGVIQREDLFVVSKLWCNSHRPDLVEPALKTSLKDLRLTELDMYLIHWPMAFDESEEKFLDGAHQHSSVDYVHTWRAMEAVYRKGLTKGIGISNFNSQQLNRIINYSGVIPQIIQVECHPYLTQGKLRKYCNNHSIFIMAYFPLGDPFFNDSTIQEIAKRYNKTTAQILIRYSLQLENIAVPQYSEKDDLLENINVFDFYIAPEDMSLISSLDCNQRFHQFEEVKEHQHYPFQPNVDV